MSELTVTVGAGKRSKLTFDEPTPPTDGAVSSSDATIATISLDADMVTWTVEGLAVGVAVMSYTGTSVAPDVGPAVVQPMTVHVVAAPVAETGDFDPASATDVAVSPSP